MTASDEDSAAPPVAIGVALMVGGCALLTINDAFMKAMIADLPVGQVVSLRGLAGFLMLVALSPLMGGVRALRPRNLKTTLLLTALMLFNFFVFPIGLRHVPFADAIMLAYLSPLVVVMLSPWLLRETVGWRRWSAVGIGLAGAALVIEPFGGDLHPAILAPLAVAVMLGLRDTLTRRVIRGESALALVAMGMLGSGLAGLVTVPAGWHALNALQTWQLLGSAAFLAVAHFCVLASFRYADAAVMACLKYTSIIWAALLGWVFWGETLGLNDWVGSALIVFSGVLITLRTRRRPLIAGRVG